MFQKIIIGSTIPFCFCAAWLFAIQRAAGQDVVLNAYAAVLAFDTCTNTLTVDNTTGFTTGDTVLMM